MSLAAAASVAVGEAAATTSTVFGQVRKNADALQCLTSQAATGKSPIFKINPPEQNNPAEYKEDDEALTRGASKWAIRVLETVNKVLVDIKTNTVQKLVDSGVAPAFLTPGVAGFANRFAKSLTELSRVVNALVLQKDQGHKVDKTAETLLQLAKTVYQQAGSIAYTEAPLVVHNGRLLVNKAAQAVTDVGDNLLRADVAVTRVRQYVLSAEGLTEIITGDRVVLSAGHIKWLQKSGSGKTILFQAAADFTVKALSGKVTMHASSDVELKSNTTARLLGASASLEAVGTATVLGSTVNIHSSGIVDIGGGSAPTSPGAPTADALTVPELEAIAAAEADKAAGTLFETSFGRNPSGVNAPRVNAGEGTNQ